MYVQAAVMDSSTDCGLSGDSRGITGSHPNLDHGTLGGLNESCWGSRWGFIRAPVLEH